VVRFPAGTRDFLFLKSPDRPWDPPARCLMGAGIRFSGYKETTASNCLHIVSILIVDINLHCPHALTAYTGTPLPLLLPLNFFLLYYILLSPVPNGCVSFLQVRIGRSRAKCFWNKCCFAYFVCKVCKKKLCGIIRDLKWIIKNNKTRFQNVLPWYHASFITVDSWGFIFTYFAIICSKGPTVVMLQHYG
jgi:hypothetical protein